MAYADVQRTCIGTALMAVVAIGAVGCSPPRPPRQAGEEELHGSAVAKELLASSSALAPPIPLAEPTPSLAVAIEDGLPERLWRGVDAAVDVESPASDRPAIVELGDLPDVAPAKPLDDARAPVASAKASVKAKTDAEPVKLRARRLDAETAKRDAEARAAAAKLEAAKAETAKANPDSAKAEAARRALAKREAAEIDARQRASARGPLLGSPSERGQASCACEPGDPLCACF